MKIQSKPSTQQIFWQLEVRYSKDFLANCSFFGCRPFCSFFHRTIAIGSWLLAAGYLKIRYLSINVFGNSTLIDLKSGYFELVLAG